MKVDNGQEPLPRRYTPNKKKRLEGARIHMKIGDYHEGRALMEDIKAFVKESFSRSDAGKVFASEILDAFQKARCRSVITPLEISLFRRHFKPELLAEWPSARYTVLGGARCYAGVCLKTKLQSE